MDLRNKTKEELLEIAKAVEVLKHKKKFNLYEFMFPDSGRFARSKYPKHLDFMAAGKNFPERMFSCGNQTGKTTTILYEGITHAMLCYPDWWTGFKFKKATVGVFGAQTWGLLRDGIQAKLFGDFEMGTGLIPKENIVKTVKAAGTAGAYEQVWVKNAKGSVSKIIFKTYDSGQKGWESMTVDWVFFDEEPPMDIYTEGSIRCMRKNGITAIGFTPDDGLTETVLHFFKDGMFEKGSSEGKFIAMVGWDDVPHLSEKAKKDMIQKVPEFLRDAKMKGIPYLGEGKVFQFNLDDYTVDPFPIPEYFERCYAVDPGSARAAILWGAIDPETGVMYVYNEYDAIYQSIYSVTEVIKQNGFWIPGVMDPFYGPQASRSMTGTEPIIDLFKSTGINIELCDRKQKGKEAGIEAIRVAFLTNKLKIFRSCAKLRNQVNLYHRVKNGKIGKTPDDFVDSLRYLVTDGRKRAVSETDSFFNDTNEYDRLNDASDGRDDITGY